MLSVMRMKSASVLVWLLLVPLILGLAGFGISDMLTGGLSNRVAKIGEDEITREEFGRAYIRALRAASEQAGRQLTGAEARELGIDSITLAQLARQKAMAAEARRLGLSVSDAMVRTEIAKIAEFKAADGSFDATRARYVLEQAGFTEQELLEDTRARMTESLIEAALVRGAVLPRPVLDQIFRFRNEQRSFGFVRLDPAQFGGTPETPADAVLQAWHDAHKADYTLPETRALTYATLAPADLAATLPVEEDALRAEYAARAALYQIPERRSVARLTFASTAEAAAERARIVAGEITFSGIAAARGLPTDQVELGDIPATSLSVAARDAVFGLPGPGLTDPVDTDLGVALYEVRAILSPKETPFETARPELQQALALRAATAMAVEAAAKVDDLIAGGAKVEEVVTEAGFKAATLDLPLTGEVTGIAADPAFRDVALKAEPGREADLGQTADGTYFVLRVDDIRPATLQPLDAVRDRVIADWTAAEQRAATLARATALAAEVSGGTPLATAAAALGLTPAEAGPFTRSATADGIPAALITAVFAGETGKAVTAEDDAGAYVAAVGQITPFDPVSPENAPLLEAVATQQSVTYGNEVFQSFVASLESRGGLEIDAAAVEAVLSTVR